MNAAIRAPFPWFGGKSRAADLVWRALGDVANYVEPFAGSLAVLLARPHTPRVETVNDLDCYLANFWRAVKAAPDDVARWADDPVNECDLHARHKWLLARRAELPALLDADPDAFDAKVAGWWVWGLSCWFGSGWCTGRASRQIPLLSRPGHGAHAVNASVAADYRNLRSRLRRVRVACGDWQRICGDCVTWRHGTTAVFLDPPYAEGAQQYAAGGTGTGLSADVRAWAIKAGERRDMRVILCGLDGEHEMPPTWRVVEWKARGGYGGQRKEGTNDNASRERLWLSPHCLGSDASLPLFGGAR